MLRDTRRDKSYFDEAIADVDDSIQRYTQRLQEPEKLKPHGRMGGFSGLCRLTLERLQYCYSRGDAPENSRQDLLNLLQYREMQRHYADALPEEDLFRRVDFERLTPGALHETLLWLAFAVCLDFDKTYYRNVLELVNNAGLDRLLDSIAIKLGQADRPLAKKLLYPKTFQSLMDVVDSPREQQSNLLKVYLDSWYESSEAWGGDDLHLITNNFAYRGYWCFEAALIVKLFNIDDSDFRNHSHYPAALVHGD